MDYIDIAGSRRTVPDGVIEKYVTKIKAVYTMLENIDASAQKKNSFKTWRPHSGYMPAS